MNNQLSSTLAALNRCKAYAASVFLTYCLSCFVGIVMSHFGNSVALSYRDRIVGDALVNGKASINYRSGNNFSAALYDCAGNLFYAAVPQTIIGFGVVFPYFTVAYQGWVGGIVSVDGSHLSRFRRLQSAAYYVIVVLLQFIPFSLTIGAGVKCGVDSFKLNSNVSWRIWEYRFPKASFQDLGYVYLVSIPIFFIASCFEFLSSWNI